MHPTGIDSGAAAAHNEAGTSTVEHDGQSVPVVSADDSDLAAQGATYYKESVALFDCGCGYILLQCFRCRTVFIMFDRFAESGHPMRTSGVWLQRLPKYSLPSSLVSVWASQDNNENVHLPMPNLPNSPMH